MEFPWNIHLKKLRKRIAKLRNNKNFLLLVAKNFLFGFCNKKRKFIYGY